MTSATTDGGASTAEAVLESSIAPHLRSADAQPKHPRGTYTPPYPSFSARFGEDVEAVVMAYFGVQASDPDRPEAASALAALQGSLRAEDGPAYVDRARYVDSESFATTITIAYWTDLTVFQRWFSSHGEPWLDPAGVTPGVGRFLELVTPTLDRFETIFSADDKNEGVAGASRAMSGMIEEHAYWGSMRDRLPLAQHDPLHPEGFMTVTVDGVVRTVHAHRNACLIRSGQDYTDTGAIERAMYLDTVELPLHAGMDFLRDRGGEIGCYDNRYMVVLDDDGAPTDRTFGLSWWRDMASLEDWAASHETHVQIFGAAMRHLSSFGPETRLPISRGHRADRAAAAIRLRRMPRPHRDAESGRTRRLIPSTCSACGILTDASRRVRAETKAPVPPGFAEDAAKRSAEVRSRGGITASTGVVCPSDPGGATTD